MKMLLAMALVGTAMAMAVHDPAAKWEGDSAFAEKTRMHHQMGIEMAESCQQKASHDELKQLCQKSSQDQRQDLERLGRLVPSSSSDDHSAHMSQKGQTKANDDKAKMHSKGMKMMQEIEAKTGDQYDKMFIMHTIKHHQQMIDMASACEKNSQNGELKSFCSELRSKQSAEKQELARMQSQWYPNATAAHAKGKK